MKKIFWLIAGITISLSSIFVSSAQANEDAYKKATGFENKYVEAYEFEHTNGNERLTLKELADIERASKRTVHYDYKAKEHYICTWEYNKILDRWVCGKNYEQAIELIKSQPVTKCAYGYILNSQKTGCVKAHVPDNAHMNNEGTGWKCDQGYYLNSTATGCTKIQSTTYVYQQKTQIVPAVCGAGKTGCGGITINDSVINIYQAETINIMPISSANPATDIIINGDGSKDDLNPPMDEPLAGTGPNLYFAFLIGFASLSIVVAIRKFAKKYHR